MRLTCPNCNAQYEVDEAVIPPAGRDVQCSSCGNTWFQYPKEVALQMREAELEDDDDDDIDGPNGAVAPAAAASAAPRIDKTVLDVLREEANREIGQRQRRQSGVETQGDLGLARPTRSKAAPQPVFGEDDPEEPELPDLPEPTPAEDDTATEAPRRRNLLPDIDELSSTLAPGDLEDGESAVEMSASEASKGGFAKGFTTILLIAIALVLLYLFAPLIAHYLPAAEGVLRGYVGLINTARAEMAALLRGVIGG